MKNAVLEDKTALSGLDRRRHSRYRLNVPVTVKSADGTEHPAISVEISESGMSLATTGTLRHGESVVVHPVAESRAGAIVRHVRGRVYGLEFVDLSKDQKRRLARICKKLPVYLTSLGF